MIKLNHEGVLNMMKQSEYASKCHSEMKLRVIKELLEIAKSQNFKIKEIKIE